MNRLLRIAQLLFGDQARQSVFEPLLADAQEEIRQSRRPALARLRWQLAMIGALGAYSPCMVRTLPMPLLADLVVRGAAFGMLAAGLQALFLQLGMPGVPVSFASTVPFIVMPVIWRLRVSSLPHHQRRFMAIAIGLASAVLTAALPDVPLTMRLALATMPACPAFMGWRVGDPAYARGSSMHNSILVRGGVLGSTFPLAACAPLLASGQFALGTYWPGKFMFGWLVGMAISASIVKRWHARDAQGSERA